MIARLGSRSCYLLVYKCVIFRAICETFEPDGGLPIDQLEEVRCFFAWKMAETHYLVIYERPAYFAGH